MSSTKVYLFKIYYSFGYFETLNKISIRYFHGAEDMPSSEHDGVAKRKMSSELAKFFNDGRRSVLNKFDRFVYQIYHTGGAMINS